MTLPANFWDPGQRGGILLAAFRDELPEFSETVLSNNDAKRYLAAALEIHSLSQRATIYCAAHLYSLAETEQPDGGVGQDDGGAVSVQSQTIGNQTITYAQAADMSSSERSSYFNRTPYGRLFLIFENRATANTLRVW